MRDFIANLLGEYTPVTYQVLEGEIISDVIPQGLSGVDFEYVFTGLLWLLVIFMFYSLLRIVLKGVLND